MKNRSRLESHRGTQDEFEVLCNTLAGLVVEQTVESFVEGVSSGDWGRGIYPLSTSQPLNLTDLDYLPHTVTYIDNGIQTEYFCSAERQQEWLENHQEYKILLIV